MSNFLGGAPMNMRLPEEELPVPANDDDVKVEIEEVPEHEANGDKLETDDAGTVVSIEHEDGSITISLDGKSLIDKDKDNLKWFGNLADVIDAQALSGIAEDLLRGIDDDEESRKDWVDERARGIRMLGLKLESPNSGASVDGAPIEGMSTVRHPLMLEAVLRFQANARSEFLPTDGPVKIRDDSFDQKDDLANALERDMNHFLTVTATEYYPDTDRMFLLLGFGGMTFKKVYFCPLRNRPVSETVDADNLIVNNAATDLGNAKRITHRVLMRKSVLRRMQLIGAYRDIELGDPQDATTNAVTNEKKSQQGITTSQTYVEDRDFEIYECYCELDIKGYEHKKDGKETGLEIPYIVTIDKSSRTILSIIRNYDESTKDMPVAKRRFVDYTFVPGFGFYSLGYLQILGNTTNALTATWRELLDAGMFSNFPGFLIAKMPGARQQTNIFRVPPGGGAQVDTNGGKINDAVMPLPYKEPSQALMALANDISGNGQRMGGTAEVLVGEGRQDAPVGTTMAMIDQATKVLNSVHKRMHSAQALEFQLLKKCFLDHPESFWEQNDRPSVGWTEQVFRKALEDFDLVPQADPNTSSHIQRLMKVTGLKQLASGSNSAMYDQKEVDKATLSVMGWSNPDRFFSKLPPQLPADQQAKLDDTQVKKQLADAKIAETKGKLQSSSIDAQLAMMEMKLKEQELGAQQQKSALDMQSEQQKAELESRSRQEEFQFDQMDRQQEALKTAAEISEEERTREFEGHKQIVDLGQDMLSAGYSIQEVKKLIQPSIDFLVKWRAEKL